MPEGMFEGTEKLIISLLKCKVWPKSNISSARFTK